MNPRTSIKHKALLFMFGCVMSLVALEIGMRLTAGIISAYQSYHNRKAVQDDGSYRILCLGESTTFFGTYKYAYPALMERMLNERGLPRSFRVFNEGQIGANSDVIIEDLQEHLQKYRPHMVIAMMGINDEIGEGPLQRESSRGLWQRFRVYALVRHIGAHWQHRFGPDAARYGIERAYQLIDDGEYGEAEEELRRALQGGASPSAVQAGLGQIYWLGKGNYDQAIAAYEQALELDPRNEVAHEDLFLILYYGQRYGAAAAAAERMLSYFPTSDQAYQNLAKVYLQTKDYVKLKNILKDASKHLPDDPVLTRVWAAYYLEQSEKELAEQYFGKFARYERQNLNPMTVRNYRRLRDVVIKRGIKLISVQYPMRNLRALEAMLDGDPQIVFVSNERNFKEAVLRRGYRELFTDHFAGDFGHLSDTGNALLATTVAEAVIAHYGN